MAHYASQTVSGGWRAISSPAKALFLSLLLLIGLHGPALPFADTIPTDWRSGVPDDNILAYEITRKGKRLGFQVIEFSEAENGDLIADVHIEIDFKLGFITLFRYRHANREVWRDGELISLVSRTDNNGDDVSVNLQRDGSRLVGSGSRYEDNLDDPILSTSYFNPNFVRQTRLVSTQDGRLLETEVEELGRERLLLQTGPVEATRFRLSGKLKIDIWYTDSGRWVKTEFTRGGNTLLITAINPAGLPPRKKWQRP